MTEEEIAEAIWTASNQYVHPVKNPVRKWKEAVAYRAGALFALDKTGLFDMTALCNAMAHKP